MRTLLTPFAFAALCLPTPAGEFNKQLAVGDRAPAWDQLSGTDGKPHSLADLKDKKAVVVVFTCNSCPVAVGYEDRVIAFAKAQPKEVAVVAINVNTAPEDRLPKMTERAAKKKFPFAYLSDPSQKIARQYGAQYTPEFFVLDADRKVAYMGAMDEKGPPAEPGAKHLEEAVKAVLAGKKPTKAETLGRGCRIKFDKK